MREKIDILFRDYAACGGLGIFKELITATRQSMCTEEITQNEGLFVIAATANLPL